MNKLIWTIIVSILFVSNAFAADKLLQPSDLTYLGAFRVPHTDMGDTGYGLSYGGEVIGFNPTNNSLFITGATQHQKVAEISIPTPVNSGALSSLNTATTLQNLYDITDGAITLHYVGNKIGSLTPFGDYILGSVYMYYDNSAGIYSHFLSSKTLSSGSDFAGLYNVTPSPAISGVTDYVSYLSGPITPIPDNSGSGGTKPGVLDSQG